MKNRPAGNENNDLMLRSNERQDLALRRQYVNAAATAEPDDLQSLLQYLSILRRHKWALLLTMILGCFVALGISLYMTPIYRATASLEVQEVREPFGTPLMTEDTNSGSATVTTQAQLLASKALRDRVYQKLNSQV